MKKIHKTIWRFMFIKTRIRAQRCLKIDIASIEASIHLSRQRCYTSPCLLLTIYKLKTASTWCWTSTSAKRTYTSTSDATRAYRLTWNVLERSTSINRKSMCQVLEVVDHLAAHSSIWIRSSWSRLISNLQGTRWSHLMPCSATRPLVQLPMSRHSSASRMLETIGFQQSMMKQ